MYLSFLLIQHLDTVFDEGAHSPDVVALLLQREHIRYELSFPEWAAEVHEHIVNLVLTNPDLVFGVFATGEQQIQSLHDLIYFFTFVVEKILNKFLGFIDDNHQDQCLFSIVIPILVQVYVPYRSQDWHLGLQLIQISNMGKKLIEDPASQIRVVTCFM